jgi:hypothetical protein
MDTDRLRTFVHPLRTGQCPSNDAILPSIQLPPVCRPTMMPGYLPSASNTDDRIIGAPRKRPEIPRSEMDLQCINPAGLSCIHERNRAAPAASPTYKSGDTPPLASATRKSQHHYYSTTTHHHFATTATTTTVSVGNSPPGGEREKVPQLWVSPTVSLSSEILHEPN